MRKIFENVNGNQFRLITEGVIADENPKGKMVREGLKKVFGSGEKVLSYKRLQGVGLGYIKSVEEAKKCAIQEARELAKEYGYSDQEESQKFVKEDETDMSDPVEKREVQIGKEIIRLTAKLVTAVPEEVWDELVTPIQTKAKELIALHTGNAVTNPGTGGISYKPGSIY